MKKIKPIWDWIKANKLKVIIPAAVLAILVFAFWYGSNTPGGRGWGVDNSTAAQDQVQGDNSPDAEKDPGTPENKPQEDPAKKPEDNNAPAEEKPAPEDAQDSTAGADKPADNKPADKPADNKPSEDKPTDNKPADKPADKPAEDKPADNPTDKPAPEEPVQPEEPKEEPKPTCTISISCSTILNNMDLCDPDKVELVPSSGWILGTTTVEFTPGESVFDVLQRVCIQYGVHMASRWTPLYNSAYIEGIHNLYEFDVGENSGWMYKVNGWFPNYGCSRYQVEDGDSICWMYTCNLGGDIGGSNSLG